MNGSRLSVRQDCFKAALSSCRLLSAGKLACHEFLARRRVVANRLSEQDNARRRTRRGYPGALLSRRSPRFHQCPPEKLFRVFTISPEPLFVSSSDPRRGFLQALPIRIVTSPR